MTGFSVLAARWPISGIGGKHITTLGIEPKAPNEAVVDDLVEVRFNANGLTPFTFDERDRLLRAFMPALETVGQIARVEHHGEHSGIVLAVIPKQADTICS